MYVIVPRTMPPDMLAFVNGFALPKKNRDVPPVCKATQATPPPMLEMPVRAAPPATQLYVPLWAAQADGIPLICAVFVSEVDGHWNMNETTQTFPFFTYRVSALTPNVSPAPLPSVAVQDVGAVTSLRSEVAGCDWCG